FVAADTRRINSNALSAVSNEGGLTKFLAAHGINAGAEMVLDEQSQAIQLSRQQGYFMMTNVVRYPPFVIASDLDRNNPVTKDIAAVVMPFASPLSVSTAAAQGARVEVLARSSAKSWLGAPDGRSFSIDPYGDFGMRTAKDKGPHNLALFLERKFSPAFPPPKGLKSKNYLTAAKSAGRLAVTGTSGFIASSYNMPDANYLFFLNLVDWMSRDADLISIRSKQVGFKPLAEVSDHGKRAARYAIILLPPLMAVLTGLFMWKRRRTLRARAARSYGAK
ncbi:MAG: hypothetical protein PHP45_01495, partial [Elusimicrobiales bacterium]|nr:hypothetical protein [Elusimicrobiales bacterium]